MLGRSTILLVTVLLITSCGETICGGSDISGLYVDLDRIPPDGTTIQMMVTDSGPAPWLVECGRTTDCSRGRLFFPDFRPVSFVVEVRTPNGDSSTGDYVPTYSEGMSCNGVSYTGEVTVSVP